MPRPPSRRPLRLRRGVTLLEVLLALGLSVLLLSGVYQALDLHWKFTTAGQAETERAQLVRALFQQLELDLRSIVFQTAPAAATSSTSSTSADGTSTSDSSADSTTDVTVIDPADAYQGADSGLVGDAQSLVLHVSRPPRDQGLAAGMAALAGTAPPGELLSVAYFLAGSGGSLQNLVSQEAASSSGAPELGQGLARLAGDKLAMQFADAQGDNASLAGQTRMLSPEVTGLQFRYFDGTAWQTTWDSVSYQRLPQAVEITLTLQPVRDADVFRQRTVESSSETYRLVVALPLAQPLTSTTGSSL